MGFVELEQVEKRFGHDSVVRDFCLSVERGELVSLLGGSGCGKTTTLRMIAGFERPSGGRISIDGKDMTEVAPNRRNVGMVFQHYALFPNLTVRQNVGFGLRVSRLPRRVIGERVDRLLALVHLRDLSARYPHQLSGGQQQRVALARALAIEPRVLLLDEPLSALDARIRASLRAEIRSIQSELAITTIYVTHDQEEALSISDRVVVMHEGRIEQVGKPSEIYDRPSTPFVASFIGTLNRVTARVADPDRGIVYLGGEPITLASALPRSGGETVTIAIRPEMISLGSGRDSSNRLAGRIVGSTFLGSIVRVTVHTAAGDLRVDTFNNPCARLPERGVELVLSFPPEACIVVRDAS